MMKKLLWTVLGLILLGAIGFGGWVLTLPPASTAKAPPIAKEENDAILAALKPRRARPTVAIIGLNDATEVTDYLMPYGILKRADVADVAALATRQGPIRLYPSLTIEAQETTADFDKRMPDGADYVIVPAMSRDDDPEVMAWLKDQRKKGAVIIGVCAGATVVANTGLLDGKRGTTHWWFLKGMRDKHPSIDYVPDRRIVVNDGVVTTTGISASMPLSLTLVEAIAGRTKAEAIARDLGLAHWDARHVSDAFKFNRPFAVTAITNKAAVWGHEQLGVPLDQNVDEVTLALVVDAWSRTFRSRAIAFAPGAVTSRNGLKIAPDQVAADWPEAKRLPQIGTAPAKNLDETLDAIAVRYGDATRDFVAVQLEYPR
ncbi:isonitrile hydratase [Variibacter gotjawalensis]|uniref:Isonitrile hydratase n=1 Tax=Variibacter gotjawalensis TaxID=1333996 RepID=A0A0S3Q170_9BRAD|nr:DJ-1/PfpI family protein [Variibacter gotjawalensis]NIK47766.1 transcriptional regulator GlxA family with amidase domain [Variibacter gotjawalensis]RZS49653.1 DJ-1/PfpI family protein [Variibacter gotjawalensis]BAT61919.1 isonitrile hydratase [Variibacter gotjawalensis]